MKTEHTPTPWTTRDGRVYCGSRDLMGIGRDNQVAVLMEDIANTPSHGQPNTLAFPRTWQGKGHKRPKGHKGPAHQSSSLKSSPRPLTNWEPLPN